jgi:hypothetical protein
MIDESPLPGSDPGGAMRSNPAPGRSRTPAFKPLRHWEDGVTTLLGLWLAVSPWFLDYRADVPALANARACGVALALIGMAAALCFRHWLEMAAATVAIWLTVAPWSLGFLDLKSAAFNALFTGAIALLMTIWTMLSPDLGEDAWPLPKER